MSTIPVIRNLRGLAVDPDTGDTVEIRFGEARLTGYESETHETWTGRAVVTRHYAILRVASHPGDIEGAILRATAVPDEPTPIYDALIDRPTACGPTLPFGDDRRWYWWLTDPETAHA